VRLSSPRIRRPSSLRRSLQRSVGGARVPRLRRLRRNYFRVRSCAGSSIADRRVCGPAPLYASCRTHGTNDEHVVGTVKVNGVPTNIVSVAASSRESWSRRSRSGRRGQRAASTYSAPNTRPGRRRAAPLRRSQLATRRDRLVRDLCLLRSCPRAPRRYFGGWIDFVISRFFDLFYAFPGRAAWNRAWLALRSRLPRISA